MQVNCSAVEAILRDMSLVPTSVRKPKCVPYFHHSFCFFITRQNAFSDRLSQFGFDIHKALLPDFMHEVELGGWKALFIHLLRMLESLDEHLLIELDQRYHSYY